jgi:uncharacterized protein (DUF1778 family)
MAMSENIQKSDRITARIPQNIKDTLEQAANISGATLNQFIVQAALKEAKEVIESERVINLSERDANTVFSLLENPPQANEKLKQAAARHQGFFSENN